MAGRMSTPFLPLLIQERGYGKPFANLPCWQVHSTCEPACLITSLTQPGKTVKDAEPDALTLLRMKLSCEDVVLPDHRCERSWIALIQSRSWSVAGKESCAGCGEWVGVARPSVTASKPGVLGTRPGQSGGLP